MATSKKSSSQRRGRPGRYDAGRDASAPDTPKLLTGGNPQIPKADGDAPVQAFIAAMPGWQREIGAQLDALVTRAVPEVVKAVRWNTPFYGVAGRGWFLGFNCTKYYVKVSFLNGAQLQPLPPVASKVATVRYLHIHSDQPIDVEQLLDWLRQAAALPGEPLF